MKFEIFNYNKNYLGFDNVEKKRIKTKRLSFECLHEFFQEKDIQNNTYEYILTSYKKKSFYLETKFYLRRSYIGQNDFHTIEIFNCCFILEGDEHQYLKKYPKNKVLGVDRVEDNDIIHFYIIIEDQRIPKIEPKTIILNTSCVVCYENDKETLETRFFKCSHNDLCIDCYKQLTIKICPICREI